jgi:hypothetical protein
MTPQPPRSKAKRKSEQRQRPDRPRLLMYPPMPVPYQPHYVKPSRYKPHIGAKQRRKGKQVLEQGK